RSLYFVGVQEPFFFYLDPHCTRPAARLLGGAGAGAPGSPPGLLSAADLDTYHTRRLRRLHVRDMDPSMLVGFLLRDRADFDSWKQQLSAGAAQHRSIVHLAEREPPQSQSQSQAQGQGRDSGHGAEERTGTGTGQGAAAPNGRGGVREEAVDEVEVLSDDDDDDEADDGFVGGGLFHCGDHFDAAAFDMISTQPDLTKPT
ncbi:Cysteine protease atg4, partial [Ascosphaera acerosa]